MSVRSIFLAHQGLVAGVSVLVVTVAGLAAVSTSSWFTDTDTIPTNTFTVGNVNLLTAPLTTAITLANMAPGDKAYGAVTVSNPGSLGLRYSVASVTGENVLAAQMPLVIKTGLTPATCNAAGFAGGVVVAGPTIVGSTGGTVVFGNPANGPHAGDRPLAAAANEVLCAEVTLNTTATQQLTSTTAVFTFNSEQTLNNP